LNYDEYRHAGDGWFDLMKSQKSSRTDVEELSNRRQFFHVDTNRDETLSRDEVALLFGFVFRIASSHKTAKAHRMARLIWKMNADTEKSKRRFAPVTLEEISDERATKKLEHHIRSLFFKYDRGSMAHMTAFCWPGAEGADQVNLFQQK